MRKLKLRKIQVDVLKHIAAGPWYIENHNPKFQVLTIQIPSLPVFDPLESVGHIEIAVLAAAES